MREKSKDKMKIIPNHLRTWGWDYLGFVFILIALKTG